ncbi:MAG TPA: hypothetical protein VF517_02115 [Thermoleophilaceae bacterium]|jgi:hypothetical protein
MKRLVLFAVVGALLVAPAADAKEYLFVGSDGTRCTVSTAHSTAPEAGGTFSADISSTASCSRPLFGAFIRAYVGSADDPFGYEAGGFSDSCNPLYPYGTGCDRAVVTAGGTRGGLAPGSYVHGTLVTLTLAQAPPPSWVVVPVHEDRPESISFVGTCRPVYADTRCHFREPFTAG